MFKQDKDMTLHGYGLTLTLKLDLARTMDNIVTEAQAAMQCFMGLGTAYQEMKAAKLNVWARTPTETFTTIADMKKLAVIWVLPQNVFSNQEPKGAYLKRVE